MGELAIWRAPEGHIGEPWCKDFSVENVWGRKCGRGEGGQL